MIQGVQSILHSCTILDSGSKLLSFVVSDMLTLAQLNSDKFRKNLDVINIKDSIQEVVQI